MHEQPMPGQTLTLNKRDVVVIASAVRIDNDKPREWTVLILNPHPPYYSVISFREDGTWSLLDFEHNIVPAAQRYEENGGAY